MPGSKMLNRLYFLTICLLTTSSTLAQPDDWWNPDWNYRLDVSVDSGAVTRIDKPVELPINFTAAFEQLRASGKMLDHQSIRIIDVSGESPKEIASQFEPYKDFQAKNNAIGVLVWMMEGTTQPRIDKRYQVYFDTITNGPKHSPEFTNYLTLSEPDEDSWKISAPGYGFYTFQKSGGVFRVFSPHDVEDNALGDWVRFDKSHYQGIPNMHSPDFSTIFHQTYDDLVASDNQWDATSELIIDGPVKSVIRSEHKIESGISTGTWEIFYEIFPSTIRCTVTKGNDKGYALIHESTPGGNQFDEDDFIRLSTDDAPRRLGDGNFNQDIEPEWAYQGDDKVKHKLYFIHNQDDDIKDAVLEFPQYDFWVLGWGRGDGATNVSPGINTYPQSYYFGFYPAENHGQMVTYIRSLTTPVKPTVTRLLRNTDAE